ncbi:conserved hypothetical protein [Histoplasma capsulatum var. duboisii H88]|uniref:Uncharacterized protein n=1 Tax=Ajellomyces capsulatus (strain H88) TaxID=544711 RepID=F0US14_AJEC8|nr:conserved hypothetical protein [Histoplasma capsulatum var. duboisii H88]
MAHKVVSSYSSSAMSSQDGKSVKIHNASRDAQGQQQKDSASKKPTAVVVHNHGSRTYDETRRSGFECSRWK